MPDELLDAVVAHFDPVRVILFGSRARGEAGADSDIDLLVVLDDDAPAAKLGWRSAFEARKDFHQAVDIVPAGGAGSRTSARSSARLPTWPPRTVSWSMSGVDPRQATG